jgi:uncharacterized protein (TIGR03083 family)
MMAQAYSLMNAVEMRDDTLDAGQIPALGHAEAGVMAREELNRFLAVVESLSGDDWQQPTDCTEWTVRDILAHQAGSYAGFASWGEFKRHMSAKPGPDQMQVDAVNARQLADRTGHSPADLIGELRQVGPKAINTRQRLPWPLRKLPIPFGPPLGTVAIEYLTDLIFTRDTWMHRVDICRATGRAFAQTPEHDGRIVALVLRDLAYKLTEHLRGQSVIFDLSGPAGGRFRIGKMAESSAILKMDVLEFNRLASERISTEDRLASERISTEEARAQGLVSVSGDHSFAGQLLSQTSVPY